MHFYESSIITSKDGIHFQVYGNEHPESGILVKPKYIPTEKLWSDSLQCRFISGKKMNRLNLWTDKEKLKKYIEEFKIAYPEYIYKNLLHNNERLFFSIPPEKIERIYSPKEGLRELMSIERNHLDSHLKLVCEFIDFILESRISLKDLGITYSSLVGHYHFNVSDINLVVFGKRNFWKLMKYLETAKHPLLKWKTEEQWMDFHKRRNRFKIFNEGDFIKLMSRKKSEGYFGDSLFIIFGVENEEETWFKWGDETYEEVSFVKVQATVKDDFNSIVRPGFYELEDSKILEGYENVPVKKLVFYSRDYSMIASTGEKIEARGILERVKPEDSEEYYRVVVGYFDSYLNERREKEYIKPIIKTKLSEDYCNLCEESKLRIGDKTRYGSVMIYKIGSFEEGWFATLSPKTGGDPEKDFSIMLMPFKHITHFSEINKNKRLSENYGIAFAELSSAMTKIMSGGNFPKVSETREQAISIAAYGKTTNWKEKKEHIHIKLFPFRGNIGQPYTVDSSYGKKEIFLNENNEEYVRMKPVRKSLITQKRLDELSKKLVKSLNKPSADLHSHTTASDGTMTPEQLIDYSIKKDIDIVAITDHDTITGIKPALEYVKDKNIELISGIEIGADEKKLDLYDIHIIGLFIDHNNSGLINLTEKLKQARIKQKKEILKKLCDLGYEITWEELEKEAKGVFGRPHIAKILERKYNLEWEGIFNELLGANGKAFVLQEKPKVSEAIKIIQGAGGIAILAHPGVYGNKSDEIIKKFIREGGQGIEVYYPYRKIYNLGEESSKNLIDRFRKIAENNNLLISGGSDFHGDIREIDLGDLGLNKEEFERLKNFKNNS